MDGITGVQARIQDIISQFHGPPASTLGDGGTADPALTTANGTPDFASMLAQAQSPDGTGATGPAAGTLNRAGSAMTKPIRIKLYGFLWLTKRGYLLFMSVGVALLVGLLIAWLVIPAKPPEGFPKFDPAKPDDTDFQLQQALVVAKAMAAQNRVIAN